MRNTHKPRNYAFLYTVIICLTCFFTFQAKGLSQPGESFTLKANDIALVEVFKNIYKQTRLKVTYSNADFNDKEKVNVNFSNTSMRDVMTFLLKDKDYKFQFIENLIIISRKEKERLNAAQPDTLINVIPSLIGKVTDAEGNPVPGATVMVKGTKQGGTTDAEGSFTLNDVKRNSAILISSIGYETRELSVKGNSILIRLNVAVSDLDETVVIAYGTTTQRLSTGNISAVKAKDIEKQPVNNPLLALQGRVPGLFISQSTGIPGGGLTVRIQGQNSLSRGNDPLYVIDGVPYTSQMLPNLSGPFGILGDNKSNTPTPVGGGNPLSFINPSDIESIEVLKDADATSIYGSRAAAGAILITTKKGQAGKTKVSLNIQQGWGKVTRMLDLLNTEQYLQIRHEAKRNDNADILPTDYDLNGTWDTSRYTNWQRELIGGTAKYTDAQASVSGGNSQTQFLLNAGYHRETTVFPGDLSDQKGMFHVNINHMSENQKFKVLVSANYTVNNKRLTNTDLTDAAIRLAPLAPALYKQDGSLNWAQLPSGNSTWYNPLAYFNNLYNMNVNNLISNCIISYQLLPGLDIKSNFGYTNMQTDESSIRPTTINAPELKTIIPRSSRFSNGAIRSYIVEPQISYKRAVSKGNLDVLLGATFLENKNDLQQLNAEGFNSDLAMKDIKSASSVSVSQSVVSIYRYSAIFGRINYNWKAKYILNLTGRRDGSSRFGSNNLFQNFGSIGAAWILSGESFLQNKLSFLSFAKMRASYGTSGNDQIGEYQFMSLYSPPYAQVPYQGSTGLIPSGLPNPYLQWEQTRKLQMGLELGFLKDRILLNATYYRNRSSNQLQLYLLPYMTGFSAIQQNLPAVIQNTGWELSVNSINLQLKDFSWSSSANLSIPKNKLVEYPGLEKSFYANTYVIGKPIINTFKAYQSVGVDPETGLFSFLSKEGHVTSAPAYPQDQIALNIGGPTLFGGVQNSVQYKQFSIDFLFQFVVQKDYDYKLGTQPGQFFSDASGNGNSANQPVSVLDRWQKPGDKAFFQRLSSLYPYEVSTSYSSASFSNLSFTDASYIRLKNISLSWRFPERWEQWMRMKQTRVYVQGQNLLTFTDYVGLDPETKSVTNLPPLKVLTLGIQLSF